MKLLDFRSRIVPHPAPAMREAMYRGGVCRDGPAANRLEALAALLKELRAR